MRLPYICCTGGSFVEVMRVATRRIKWYVSTRTRIGPRTGSLANQKLTIGTAKGRCGEGLGFDPESSSGATENVRKESTGL